MEPIYCFSCTNAITGQYQTRRYAKKEYLLCRVCSQDKRCEACDRPQSRENGVMLDRIDTWHEEHGRHTSKLRYMCTICKVDAVDTIIEARKVLITCIDFLQKEIGLRIPEMHINLTFSDNISNVSRNCSSEGNGHCRTRVSRKELEDGWIECTREIVEISVLRGMHRIYLGRTLCHELIHFWLGIYSMRLETMDVKITEGICELAAMFYLKSKIEEIQRQQLRHNTSYYNQTRRSENADRYKLHFHRLSIANTALETLFNNNIYEYAEGLRLAQSRLIEFQDDFGRHGDNNGSLSRFFNHVAIYGDFYASRSCLCVSDLVYEAMLSQCSYCNMLVDPCNMNSILDSTKFAFVENGSQTCHLLCFHKYVARKCIVCKENLIGRSVIEGKDMHEECFLKSSDCCARCGKSLWERDTEEASTCPKKPTSESQAYNRRTGSFVRRTSVTDQGEVVHIRCSDKCKYCCEPICKYPSVKGKQLHKKCFLNYQKNIVGDVCKVCNGVLWEIDESSGRLFRRTFNTKTDGEVHISCLRCAVCHGKFDDRDFERKENGHADGCVTDPNGCLIHASCGPKCKYCGDPLYAEKFLLKDESAVHMKCFVAYRAEIYGETCAICSKPLWEENKEQGGSRGFRRRSSFSKTWNGDVHVHCLESSQGADQDLRSK